MQVGKEGRGAEEVASLKRARAADCQRIGASNKQVCAGRQQQQAGERCMEGREEEEESRRGAAAFSSCPANRLA